LSGSLNGSHRQSQERQVELRSVNLAKTFNRRTLLQASSECLWNPPPIQ